MELGGKAPAPKNQLKFFFSHEFRKKNILLMIFTTFYILTPLKIIFM